MGATQTRAAVDACKSALRLASASGEYRRQRFTARPVPKPRLSDDGGLILVSDDEATIVRLIGGMLTSMRRRWIGASTLTEAAKLIAAGGIERIILDWRWPTEAPLVVIEMAKEEWIPIVIFSGFVPLVPAGLGLRAIEK